MKHLFNHIKLQAGVVVTTVYTINSFLTQILRQQYDETHKEH